MIRLVLFLNILLIGITSVAFDLKKGGSLDFMEDGTLIAKNTGSASFFKYTSLKRSQVSTLENGGEDFLFGMAILNAATAVGMRVQLPETDNLTTMENYLKDFTKKHFNKVCVHGQLMTEFISAYKKTLVSNNKVTSLGGSQAQQTEKPETTHSRQGAK